MRRPRRFVATRSTTICCVARAVSLPPQTSQPFEETSTTRRPAASSACLQVAEEHTRAMRASMAATAASRFASAMFCLRAFVSPASINAFFAN